MRAEDLHQIAERFDAITCLWNVMGHIFPADARAEVLQQFARLVAPGGRIFLDVNHRYNSRSYGIVPTIGRFLHDRLLPNETNGDVEVNWGVCTTRGHVFTDREMKRLFQAANLTIEKRVIVDYATGQLRRGSWQGNLFYVLRP
jgi:2-polyprenyl-3-methyl-5-hydroxy-6-metoxy-1,4-benzoquinol methylase